MSLLLVAAVFARTLAEIPGTDPTGEKDSSPALNAYLRKLCNGTDLPSGPRPRGPGMRDLNLESGIYRMDSPLVIDSTVRCHGPVRVRDGTLLAGPGFGDDRFLVESVGPYWGGRFVGMTLSVEHVVFANNFTGGGLLANETSFVTVSDCNFINFATYGVWTTGGDFRLDRSILMECTDGMEPCQGPNLKATAVYINGPDSHFNRNVIACTHVGIVNAEGDNFYYANHIWTNCHPPSTDNGTDYNMLGFLISGGSPQISGSAIDNCHLVVESHRGLIVTNTHFNEASRLIIAPPSLTKGEDRALAVKDSDTRCEYWKGSLCSFQVVGNTFTCRDEGRCGLIQVDYTPPKASSIQVYGNTWEDANNTLCSLSSSCSGDDCKRLFGPCSDAGPTPGTVETVAPEWVSHAERLCLQHGLSFAGLALLDAPDQAEALREAGLSPLQRARVLSALA